MNNFDALLASTFAWIERHVDDFRLERTSDESRRIDLLKPLGELVLTCLILGRCIDGGYVSRANVLLDLCWSEIDEGRYLITILRAYPELLVLTSIYANFRERGYRNEELEREIAFIAGLQGIRALEFPAWRRLDLVCALEKIGCVRSETMSTVFNSTWLAAEPEPWSISDSAAYSITHTVFYMTDFGRLPHALPARSVAYIRRWVSIWMRYYSELENLDLLAEFVMVLRCTGSRSDELDAAGVITRLQLNDGSIPGPQRGGQLLMLGETDPERIKFIANYHTTLVTTMAAALSHTTV